MSRAHQADDVKRADMVGASVTILEGKAREAAIDMFFSEKVPSVRGEKVVKQKGLPEGLDLLPLGALK